jgi:TolB-like protein/DNA-binding winged helix-turn-helix (wHTH) protein
MERASHGIRLLRFGPYEFDLKQGELRRSGVTLSLQGQPLQILQLLLLSPKQLVSREQFRQALWPNGTFVDFDDGLNTGMRRLRQVLGDDADQPRFIETLPRRGYRFLVDVDAVPDTNKDAVAAGINQTAVPLIVKRRRNLPILVAVGISLAVVAGVGRTLLNHRSAAAPTSRSIAVLPLVNVSQHPDQEYFADGMTDELITDLAKIRSLRVISHSSVWQYSGSRKALPQIARELGVDLVVTGSVLRSGDRVRVRAQLLDARADRHIWADSYEGDLHDVIAVQNEIALEIAGQIRIQLTPEEQANLAVAAPRVPEAYEYYFRSRYFINNRRSVDGLRKSVEYSHRAILADPNYSLAYAGLAHSLISLSFNNGMSPKEAMPQAEAAAKQALQLDPSLSQAHVALGWIRTAYDWDWEGAERETQRALDLDPNNPDAHRVRAHYLQAIGRTSEAIEEERRSLELDPFSVWENRNLGRALLFERRYDEAIAQFQKAAEMDPHSAVIFKWIAWSYEQKGMEREAVRFDLRDQVNSGLSPENAKILEEGLSTSGPKHYWEELLQVKLRIPETEVFELARINAHLGRKEKAFAWLKVACQQRVAWMTWVKVDPTLDPLRADPQFADVLRCVNM